MTDFRTGIGYDSHRLAEGLPLRLGGVDIDYPLGCVAHSDGDAVIHALCDALFGAAGMDDIGTHFPDNDPRFKGADSRKLLTETVRMLQDDGWRIHNADVTIILEKPKLAPYKQSIKETLARILQIPVTALAVKAKTNEQMDAVGRGEGVAAIAAVSIIRAEN